MRFCFSQTARGLGGGQIVLARFVIFFCGGFLWWISVGGLWWVSVLDFSVARLFGRLGIYSGTYSGTYGGICGSACGCLGLLVRGLFAVI